MLRFGVKPVGEELPHHIVAGRPFERNLLVRTIVWQRRHDPRHGFPRRSGAKRNLSQHCNLEAAGPGNDPARKIRPMPPRRVAKQCGSVHQRDRAEGVRDRAQREVDLPERTFNRDALVGKPAQRRQERKPAYQRNRCGHRSDLRNVSPPPARHRIAILARNAKPTLHRGVIGSSRSGQRMRRRAKRSFGVS